MKFAQALLLLASSTQAWASDFGERLNHFEFPDCSNPPLKGNIVCDTSLTSEERARGLIAQLTLEEKANNTQNKASGVPRLGIAPYNWWGESLHGLADSPGVRFSEEGDYSYATVFPQVITLGATFDDDLVYDMATVISTEARVFSNDGRAGLDFWSPVLNPFRDPRWGRGQEAPGEDVLHVQRYTYNFVTGLQGQDRKKVIACCKHFAAYDLEDWNGIDRHHFNAVVSSQDMAEYYLAPFKTCTRDAKAGSVMCSYNSVNGIPACANSFLMQTILRDHWNWKASNHWVTSDCGAVEDLFGRHNYSDSYTRAAADCLNAGTDINCNEVSDATRLYVVEAVEQGLVDERIIDRALVRLFSSLIDLGYFDSDEQSVYRKYGFDSVNTPQSVKLAYESAIEGIVLLKNNQQFLPWNPSPDKSVVLAGPFVNSTISLLGNYAGKPKNVLSPREAVKALGWNVINDVSKADIVIYFGGLNNDNEAETLDRTEITWPVDQLQEIIDISRSSKSFAIVQFGAGQLDDSDFLQDNNIDAIIWAGYPGQEGTRAILDIISGVRSPSGRLPVTQYPGNYVSLPMTDMTLRPSDKNPGRTYRWYDNAVLEFGHGLHYTDFEVTFSENNQVIYSLDTLLISYADMEYYDKIPFATVELKVKNRGTVTSDYVALLFMMTDVGPSPIPRKTLVSYERVHDIKPGQEKLVKLDIDLGTIARVRDNGDLVAYPGNYRYKVDLDGPELNFEITGTQEYILDYYPEDTESGSLQKNYFEEWFGGQHVFDF